jgi:GTP-binding protein
MNLHNAEFIKSAVGPADFVRDGLPQVIFSGKSNVGKSSVINKILNRKNFARVGGSPGKTVHINYFLIDKSAYFVDLPGYGYAKVSKSERDRWGRLMEDYFDEPDLITLGILIVDIRHKPTADDYTMACWFRATACPLVVVANKMDKVRKNELEENLKVIRETLNLDDSAVVLPFSAAKGTNRDRLIAEIEKSI